MTGPTETQTRRIEAGGDRSRWVALYVLCAGVLMIVLDATVVNVALPAIQDDLGFSPVEPGLGRQRLPDRLRRPAAARRPARRPDLAPRRLPRRPRALHRSPRCVCGLAQSQEMLVGARFLQGIGGAMASAVVLGMIVTMFPEPRRAGEGDRRLRLRRLGRRLGRPARRRRPHPGDQLALDLLHQHADRRRSPRCSRCGCSSATAGLGFGQGADVLGAVLVTASLMLGVYTIVEPAAKDGWGDRADARALGARLAGPARRLPRPRGDAPRTRSCRCGSSAPATSPAPT